MARSPAAKTALPPSAPFTIPLSTAMRIWPFTWASWSTIPLAVALPTSCLPLSPPPAPSWSAMPAPAPSLSFPSVKSALWSAPSAWYCSSSAGSSIAWARSFGSLPSFQRSPSSTVSISPGRRLAPAASSPESGSRSSFPATFVQGFFNRCRNNFADAFAQLRHIFLLQSLCLYGVVQTHSNFRWPQHPVARPVMLERSHQTNRYDRNPKLLRDAEATVLKFIQSPVARALGFRKNNQAGAPIDSVLRQPPHTLQIRRPSDLKRMRRLTQDAVDGGTSLIIFPEAKRTRDGRLNEFQDGGFRVAQQLGIPIVPVSLVGSFEHHRTGHWMLWPAKVTVRLHDTIETKGLKKEDVPELRERVREIIAAPVEEALNKSSREARARA